jgi:hypothetical protein
MTPIAQELRGWGCDLNTKLNGPMAARLAAAHVPASLDPATPPIGFVARYVSLGQQQQGDLSIPETEAILASGLALFAVQHCRSSQGGAGWETSGARGASDGHWAALNAAGAGLITGIGITVVLDLEDVAQSTWGAPTMEHATEWCRQVAIGGFVPCVYVGFACGLSAEQLYEIPTCRRYWSDFGPRAVATRGFAMKQHQQTIIAGIQVDPDFAFEDQLGGTLVGMAPGLITAA